jgi:spoIIIJ-associated protein
VEKKYKLEAIRPRIQQFLDSVFRNAGLAASFDIVEGAAPHPEIENPEVVVKFHGEDVDLLLANRGELLLALEQLTMEMLRMPGEDHSLLCFDANDYRMLRIEELRMSAVTAADKVKKTRIPFRFSPMSSRERRIIHLALRNEPAVRSESTGVGPGRQVVIYPAGMPSSPDIGGSSRPPSRPAGRSRRR